MSKSITAYATYQPWQRNGISFEHPHHVANALREFDRGSQLEITIDYLMPPHSRQQEKFYHCVVVANVRAVLQELTGQIVSHLDVHEFLKLQFNAHVFSDANWVLHRIGKSTRKLSTAKYSDYVERCIQYCVVDLDLAAEKFADWNPEEVAQGVGADEPLTVS